MEPSVEKGFSFLDLEDCDVEARQYLETIIEQRGSSSTTGVADPNKSKPSDKGEPAIVNNVRAHSTKLSAARMSDTSISGSCYPTESMSSKEGQAQCIGAVQDIGVATSTRISNSDKETLVATNYEASLNVALPSRGSTRGGPQQPSSFQAPNQMNFRPIQQGPASSGLSNYIADAPQISSNQISGNSGTGGHGGNVHLPFHAPSGHPIQQHHQQAYAAAAVAAANVQQQHVANQQTPYVFINQVTANVNVHHGPVSNGNHQQQTGLKDTGNNSSGSNQQLQMQQSPGVGAMPNLQAVSGPSLSNVQPTGIHPIHMQSGQIGASNGMVPQSMNQPPPLQANVATSLAAGGMSPHPHGTMLHQMMPNTFQIPHQMTTGPMHYNAIPSRSGTVPLQQQPSTIPPNPASMMSMQQLQQMYGYPIFFSPNATSQIPSYGPSGALHGMTQQQMAQVHPAQVAHMAQLQQAQINVQQNANQRQGIYPQPLQSQPVILRNPLSPPVMQPGTNSISIPSGIPVSQAHHKIGTPAYTTNQRSSMQSNSTSSSIGVSQNAPIQPTVPQHMLPSINSSPHMKIQSQLNPQAAFFPPQQTTNVPIPISTVATPVYPSSSFYVGQSQNKNVSQDTTPIASAPRFKSPSISTSSSLLNPTSSTNTEEYNISNSPPEVGITFEKENEEKNQSSNDEVSTQEEDEGLAFGTVDLKSLVAEGNVNVFENESCGGPQYYAKSTDSSEQMSKLESGEIQDDEANSLDKNDDNISKEKLLTNERIATVEQLEENKIAKNEKVDDVDIRSDMTSPLNSTSDVPAKSWASLFKSKAKMAAAGPTQVPTSNDSVYLSEGKPTARIQPYKESLNEGVESIGTTSQSNRNDMAFSGKDVEMGNFLKEYSLNHRAPSIKPRGLSNRSNWCFVNAILQALVACPPFYNLMKSLPNELLVLPSSEPANPSVKILKAAYYFFSEFLPLDNFPKLNHRSKNKKNEDLPLGKIFEPTTIYNFLLNLNSDNFKVIEGRQEDAEEFLTFLLNGLNDEMIALLKLVEQQERDQSTESEELQGSETHEKEEDEDDDDEWREVGPRGTKSCVTRRVEKRENGNCAKSPLAEMFQGQMRSQVQHSNGEPTATLQPFLTLQLDIQSPKIRNVADAIACNFAEEAIDGYMCSKTNQEIEASRSMSLEELPSILVLHLKRFIYDGSSNGCQKLLKNIDFPVDLEINRDILSSNSRNKYPTKQRQYKLFAVVYHNGSEATKGHYITDIYHTGLSTWLRCDDSILKPQTESMVLAHSATSVPYILFYRRGDTMVGGPLNDKSGNKNISSSNTTKA